MKAKSQEVSDAARVPGGWAFDGLLTSGVVSTRSADPNE